MSSIFIEMTRENLKKENLDKVEALAKSGEFKQAFSALAYSGDYGDMPECLCFMGLVTEAYRRDTGDGYWAPVKLDADDESHTLFGYRVGEFGIYEEIPPDRVLMWLGIYYISSSIARMNDTERRSFEDIIEYLRNI